MHFKDAEAGQRPALSRFCAARRRRAYFLFFVAQPFLPKSEQKPKAISSAATILAPLGVSNT